MTRLERLAAIKAAEAADGGACTSCTNDVMQELVRQLPAEPWKKEASDYAKQSDSVSFSLFLKDYSATIN